MPDWREWSLVEGGESSDDVAELLLGPGGVEEWLLEEFDEDSSGG